MRTYRSTFRDPYSNNPYLPRDQVYVSIHSDKAEEGGYLKPFISLSKPLPYDFPVRVYTDNTEYKQANYRGEGGDYKELDKYVTIPKGEILLTIPIPVYQNEDPDDWATEYTLIKIDTSSLPEGVNVGTGSARLTIVDVPTWDMSPEIMKGTRGNDHFPVEEDGKDKVYVGKGGHEDQLNFTGKHSIFDGLTVSTDPTNGSITLHSPHYGDIETFGIEYAWDEASFQFKLITDLGKDVNVVEGTNGSDILWTTGGLDHLLGKGGNDYLVFGYNNHTNDVADGGYGRDTVVYVNPGDINEYSFVGKGGQTDMISVNNRHNGTTDTLYDIEEVMFVDVDANYNIVGVDIHSAASLIA